MMDNSMIGWIFPITALCLVAVEIILIIAVLKLKKEVNKLNSNIDAYFGELLKKIKAVVELFLQVQLGKIGSGELSLKTNNLEAELKVHERDKKEKKG